MKQKSIQLKGLPSDVRELGFVLEELDVLGCQHVAVRDVGEISEGDLIAGEVLLLGEDPLVTGELALKGSLELSNPGIVGLGTVHGGKYELVGDAGCVRVEVEGLDRGGGLEESTLLRVGGEEGRIGLGCDVAGDGTRLVDDEPIVILLPASDQS
jgi:hypothetical protein